MKISKLNKGDIIVNNDLKATVIDPNWKGGNVCQSKNKRFQTFTFRTFIK